MARDHEEIYVWHSGLDAYAWIPKSAQRQHGLQGWVEADPLANSTGADMTEPTQPTEPTPGEAEPKSRARGSAKPRSS